MKFAKTLQSHLEVTLPEWRDKFVAYKQLKKRLKLLKYAPDGLTVGAFIPANEAPDSDVARVDSMLRNHYGNRTEGWPVRMVDEREQGAGAGGGVGACPGANAGAQEGEERTFVRKRKTRDSGVDSDEEENADSPFESGYFPSDQMEFIRLLNVELNKFNKFFIEKEEEYVIRLQDLKRRIESMKEAAQAKPQLSVDDRSEMNTIFRQMITFHGEMVLLETYSSLNYTGLVKILKKHDKWTGGVLRMPYIQTVLHQPFYTTELLSRLVKDCEVNLSDLFPVPPTSQQQPGAEALLFDEGEDSVDSDSEESHVVEAPKGGSARERGQSDEGDLFPAPACNNLDIVHKSCEAALKTIKDIRMGSSTYSALSMPPLDPPDVDDDSLGVVINEAARDSPSRCRSVSVSED